MNREKKTRSTLLVDNGSLEPAATLGLRGIAANLSARLGTTVEPVSLLHSSAIEAARLNGQAAEILFPALERRLAAGRDEFIILPLFFGPSQALTVYLPENLARLKTKHSSLRVQIAPPLYAAGDDRLARILVDRIEAELSSDGTDRVALVDHGSPVAGVTAVRNELAHQIAARLKARVVSVAPCSMERRPEPAYDFNDPLLSALLATEAGKAGRLIVAMQFLLSGRHAGPEGDVAQICRAAESSSPGLKTVMTALIGDHPLVVDILADRWREAESLV